MNPATRRLLQVARRGRGRGRRDLHDPDGRRRRAAAAVHRDERAERLEPGHLTRWPTRPKTPEAPAEQKIPISIEEEIRRSYLDYAMSRHRRAGAPRRPRRPEARPPPRPLRDVGAGEPRRQAATRSRPASSATSWASTTRTATRRSTTRSSGWRRTSRCASALVDGQGNFGSVDGDAAAAMRYTEIAADAPRRGDARRRHRQGDRRLDARTTTAPCPSRRSCRRRSRTSSSTAPRGSPSAWRRRSRRTTSPRRATPRSSSSTNPRSPAERSCRSFPGPDFPTGGVILGRGGILEAYRTGRGILQVRGAAEVGADDEGGPRGDRRHRDPVPGEQGAAHRADRRRSSTTRGSRGSPPSATSRTGRGCASSST